MMFCSLLSTSLICLFSLYVTRFWIFILMQCWKCKLYWLWIVIRVRLKSRYVLYKSRQFFMPSHACQYKRCTHIEVLEIGSMTLQRHTLRNVTPLEKTRKMSFKGSLKLFLVSLKYWKTICLYLIILCFVVAFLYLYKR